VVGKVLIDRPESTCRFCCKQPSKETSITGASKEQGLNEHCKVHLAEQEERLVLVEEICIDKGALVLDPATEEVYFSANEDAYKDAYVAVVSGMGQRPYQGYGGTGIRRHEIRAWD
jgi:hypothetical protein